MCGLVRFPSPSGDSFGVDLAHGWGIGESPMFVTVVGAIALTRLGTNYTYIFLFLSLGC